MSNKPNINPGNGEKVPKLLGGVRVDLLSNNTVNIVVPQHQDMVDSMKILVQGMLALVNNPRLKDVEPSKLQVVDPLSINQPLRRMPR